MAFPAENEDRTVMDQAIDHGGRRHFLREYLPPPFKGQIGGESDAAPFIPLRYDLEKQIARFTFARNIAQLVDQQYVDTIKVAKIAIQRTALFGVDEFHEQSRRRREQRAVPAHAHAYSKRGKNMRFPSARRTAEDQVPVFFNERSIEVFQNFRLGKFGLKAEIKGFNGLRGREMRGRYACANTVLLAFSSFQGDEVAKIWQRLSVLFEKALVVRQDAGEAQTAQLHLQQRCLVHATPSISFAVAYAVRSTTGASTCADAGSERISSFRRCEESSL